MIHLRMWLTIGVLALGGLYMWTEQAKQEAATEAREEIPEGHPELPPHPYQISPEKAQRCPSN